MKIAIRYFSKTGNTKKLADAISDAIGIPAESVDKPLTENVDILFLGSSVMATQPRREVKKFIKAINVEVGEVVNFGTAAFVESTYGGVKRLVEKKGITMSEKEFHCRGSFNGMHTGKPDESDLSEAATFAKSVVGK